MKNKKLFLKLLDLLSDDDQNDNKCIIEENDNITPFVPHPFIIGKKYFIRTVTLYFAGTLKDVYPNELVLDQVNWIPDTGRFNEAIKSGNFMEQEPYGDDIIISRGSIIDCKPVEFKIILETK